MTDITMTRSEPVFPRRLIVEQTLFALMAWAGFTLFILLLTLVVSFVRPIDVSGWNLAGQPARWFAFVIGIYLGFALFPLYVTHGGTRKGYMCRMLTFGVTYSVLLAVLFAISFFIEAGFYGIMDWPQALHDRQLYASPLDFPVVALQWLMIMMLWLAGGLFIGIAWYRDARLGALAILVALLFAGLSAMAIGGETGPHLWVYQQLLGGEQPGLAMAVGLHLVSIAILLGLTWLLMRNAPINAKSS